MYRYHGTRQAPFLGSDSEEGSAARTVIAEENDMMRLERHTSMIL